MFSSPFNPAPSLMPAFRAATGHIDPPGNSTYASSKPNGTSHQAKRPMYTAAVVSSTLITARVSAVGTFFGWKVGQRLSQLLHMVPFGECMHDNLVSFSDLPLLR